ncbi:MAG: hypothetical protein ACK4P3_04105 [Fimbriimonadaceae bacterium]
MIFKYWPVPLILFTVLGIVQMMVPQKPMQEGELPVSNVALGILLIAVGFALAYGMYLYTGKNAIGKEDEE